MSTERETLRCDLAAEVIRSYGELRLQVTGTSMAPAVWPGDVLQVRREEDARIQCGEIVLFGRDGRLFAHRVVDQVSDRRLWITRGDRLWHNDPPVSSGELLGRVCAIQRGARTIDPAVTRGWRYRVAGLALRCSDRCTNLVLRLRGLL